MPSEFHNIVDFQYDGCDIFSQAPDLPHHHHLKCKNIFVLLVLSITGQTGPPIAKIVKKEFAKYICFAT